MIFSCIHLQRIIPQNPVLQSAQTLQIQGGQVSVHPPLGGSAAGARKRMKRASETEQR